MAVEYRRCGTLQVASAEHEASHLQQLAGELTSRGIRHELLTGAEARALEPALAEEVRTALLVPEHGYVKVSDLMTALQAAASRHGVQMAAGRVDRIEPVGGGVRVHAGEVQHEADVAVIAAGPWSGPLATPAVPVYPIRGQLLHLRLAKAPLAHVVWGEGCYMVPWEDGSLLVGATSEDVGFDESSTPEAVSMLRDAAMRHVPVSADAVLDRVRVGLRPATSDELPLMGRSSTMRGVVYATGHFRNGVLLTPLSAALLADLVIDGRSSDLLDLMRPSRFGL
jgi:glycine oxidase